MNKNLKVKTVIALLASGWLNLFSAPPSDYYDTVQGKTGRELRQALHEIIKNHVVIPYSSSTRTDTVDALDVLDQETMDAGNVVLVYSLRSEPKTNYPAIWTHEHLWPQSRGIDASGPDYSDLFNLRPEDATVNSARNNKYYDESDPLDSNYRNPAHVEAPLCSTDSDSWEPPASMNGDISRSLFYMDVRYEGDKANEPDLKLTDFVNLITSNDSFMGKLSMLLAWHRADPVSAAEEQRNDLIYTQYQNNRNPFIDHPEWVDLIYRPRLTLINTGGSLQLGWGLEFSNAVLETSTEFRNWTTVTNSPMPSNGQWIVLQVPSNNWQFYRLR